MKRPPSPTTDDFAAESSAAPALSIIIVNWNSKEYLNKCIASILANTKNIKFEIIVIDSGSFDGCGEMLQTSFPQVRFIQSEGNIGFAKANNLAYQSSKGDALLFLNPDTELIGPAINTAFNYLEQNPGAGAIGCKLLNSDGSLQKTSTRSFPTLLNQILESDLLRNLFPRSRLWGMAPLLSGTDVPLTVDAVSGAFMMLRRSLYEEVGGFTPHYFMYSEDIDLCFKTKNAGYQNFYLATATVTHHGGSSSAQTKVNQFSSVMMLESRWRFFKRNRSLPYAIIYRFCVIVSSLIRICISIPLSVLALFSTGSRRWRVAITKWWILLRWCLGFERWVTKY